MSTPVRRADLVAGGVAASFGAGLFLGPTQAAALAGGWLPLATLLGVLAGGAAVLSTWDRPLETLPDSLRRFGFALSTLARLAAAVALAGTVAVYLTPFAALAVVVVATVLAAVGVPPVVVRVAATVVVGVLLLTVIACFTIAPVAPAVAVPDGGSVAGVLGAAGLLAVCMFGTAPVAWGRGAGARGAQGGVRDGAPGGADLEGGGALGCRMSGGGAASGDRPVSGTVEGDDSGFGCGGVVPEGDRPVDPAAEGDEVGSGCRGGGGARVSGTAESDAIGVGASGLGEPESGAIEGDERGVGGAAGGGGPGGGADGAGASGGGGGADWRWGRFLVVGVVGVLVLAVVVAVVRQLGAARLAISPAPLRAALDAADAGALQTLLLIAVVVGCGFSLLAVLRGLSAGGVPRVRVVVAAGIVAAGGVLLIPATAALAGAAVLLLGDSAFRLVAARHRPGGER